MAEKYERSYGLLVARYLAPSPSPEWVPLLTRMTTYMVSVGGRRTERRHNMAGRRRTISVSGESQLLMNDY